MTRFHRRIRSPHYPLVDDNPSVLYVKSRLLSRQGYRVIEASNGVKGLRPAAAERLDLTDIDGPPHFKMRAVTKNEKFETEMQSHAGSSSCAGQ